MGFSAMTTSSLTNRNLITSNRKKFGVIPIGKVTANGENIEITPEMLKRFRRIERNRKRRINLAYILLFVSILFVLKYYVPYEMILN